MKEVILPIGLIAVIACMLLPLPPFVVDILLVGNLVFAILLVASALYLKDPLKLSSLPTILLLSTLYRLALNISTTRMIIGSGDAGEMINMFGELLMQGEIFVGLIVFLVITLVQFIVIAKGSERVAEVAARFTLDALPGKQMSIDADVRSGMIDMATARKKRESLQVESRFYGALDGAMKFIKGDAIAGIVITAINILGGLGVGLIVYGLSPEVALQKYTLLTLGDGLLSQIPALLNSLAAGLIVTRVAREDSSSLASEVLEQMSSSKQPLFLAGIVAALLATIGVATMSFIVLAIVFVAMGYAASRADLKSTKELDEMSDFQAKLPELLTIKISTDNPLRKGLTPNDVKKCFTSLLQKMYDEHGLLLSVPALEIANNIEKGYLLEFRGIPATPLISWSEEALQSGKLALSEVMASAEKVLIDRRTECIDDIFTRRLLDNLESHAPELVTSTIPGVVSVTTLSSLLRNLVKDSIPIRALDVILQSVSENADLAQRPRMLLEEVRIALRRSICLKLANNSIIEGVRLDPVLDMLITKSERENAPMDPKIFLVIENEVRNYLVDDGVGCILLASRGSRRLLSECLALRGIRPVTVIAEEELSSDIVWLERGYIQLPESETDDLFEWMAA